MLFKILSPLRDFRRLGVRLPAADAAGYPDASGFEPSALSNTNLTTNWKQKTFRDFKERFGS